MLKAMEAVEETSARKKTPPSRENDRKKQLIRSGKHLFLSYLGNTVWVKKKVWHRKTTTHKWWNQRKLSLTWAVFTAVVVFLW